MKDLDELMAELSAALTPGRTNMDRYREFRSVFLSNDQGKRVLHDIMRMGRMYDRLDGNTSHETYRRVGMRDMAIYILGVIFREPDISRPTVQQSVENKDNV